MHFSTVRIGDYSGFDAFGQACLSPEQGGTLALSPEDGRFARAALDRATQEQVLTFRERGLLIAIGLGADDSENPQAVFNFAVDFLRKDPQFGR